MFALVGLSAWLENGFAGCLFGCVIDCFDYCAFDASVPTRIHWGCLALLLLKATVEELVLV